MCCKASTTLPSPSSSAWFSGPGGALESREGTCLRFRRRLALGRRCGLACLLRSSGLTIIALLLTATGVWQHLTITITSLNHIVIITTCEIRRTTIIVVDGVLSCLLIALVLVFLCGRPSCFTTTADTIVMLMVSTVLWLLALELFALRLLLARINTHIDVTCAVTLCCGSSRA